MSKNQKKLYTGIFIAIFFGIFITWTSDVQVARAIPEHKTENQKNTQSATLLVGDITDHLSFALNTILYDVLVQAKNAGKIGFSGRNYLGLGFFVTDIGTLHASNGKSLIYYINGKVANVGVSSYILKNGDIIKWKLE